MSTIEQQIEELQKQVEVASALREALLPEYNRIGAELSKHYGTMKTLNEQIRQLRLQTSVSQDVSWLLAQEWSKDIVNTFARLVGFGEYELGISGQWTETQQSVVRVTLPKNDGAKARKIWDKMVELLPFITQHSDGYRRVDMFEHTLSEHGVYHILVDSDNVFYESFCRYGRDTITKIGDNDTAFNHFFKNRYYGDSYEDSEV